MPSGRERSSMKICSHRAGTTINGRWSCCYGELGCTAAPLSKEGSVSQEQKFTGNEPKQRNGSEQSSRQLRVDLSEECGLQDLYLLLSALLDTDFAKSVTALATPSRESVPLPSDTQEQSGYLIMGCLLIEWLRQLDAHGLRLRSTTPSSKQRGLCNTEKSRLAGVLNDMAEEEFLKDIKHKEEPRNRRY